MATTNQCIASLARLGLSSAFRPKFTTIPSPVFSPICQMQLRNNSGGMASAKAARQREKLAAKRKRNRHKEYKYAVPSLEEQYSLCDAMRYLRAAEVGRPPSSATYELALKIRTTKNSRVVRDRIRLPYPVKNDTKIAVICKEDSSAMQDARNAGAVAFGEETLFEMIRKNANNLPFNRLICHVDSEQALKRANLGRILGPKNLMPSIKTNTITRSIVGTMHEMVGAETYREKIGVVRIPIGNIQFTPRMLADNIKTMIKSVKNQIMLLEDTVNKNLIEVVLSSTSGPGFPLNGEFLSEDPELTPAHLSTAM
ncbi:50S ribosomal protein L1 [Xylariaceae sp. FL0594]|nr:50S ribosomal protein L1 [Xylariaceae sp. FL0594]